MLDLVNLDGCEDSTIGLKCRAGWPCMFRRSRMLIVTLVATAIFGATGIEYAYTTTTTGAGRESLAQSGGSSGERAGAKLNSLNLAVPARLGEAFSGSTSTQDRLAG